MLVTAIVVDTVAEIHGTTHPNAELMGASVTEIALLFNVVLPFTVNDKLTITVSGQFPDMELLLLFRISAVELDLHLCHTCRAKKVSDKQIPVMAVNFDLHLS